VLGGQFDDMNLNYTEFRSYRSLAVYCSMLQCVAVCRSVLQRVAVCGKEIKVMSPKDTDFNVLRCVAERCSVLQFLPFVSLCCSVLGKGIQIATHSNTLQHTATHSNTLQHAAMHCNNDKTHPWAGVFTSQRAATHCNTLQHTASR